MNPVHLMRRFTIRTRMFGAIAVVLLVEQSAAAAESLKEQAAQLAGVVGTFRLAEARETAAA